MFPLEIDKYGKFHNLVCLGAQIRSKFNPSYDQGSDLMKILWLGISQVAISDKFRP